jgi:hypothetical protein
LPGCTIRVAFIGGAVAEVLGFFLGVLLNVFSLGSFDLSAGVSSLVAGLAAMAPQISCSSPCHAHAENDYEGRGGKRD